MKQSSVGSSAGSSGSVLTYPQQKEAARDMYLGGKKTYKTPTQTVPLALLRRCEGF